jgi:hypothetical protein
MQFVQWQRLICVGSPMTEMEAEPQAQRAVRCMVEFSYSGRPKLAGGFPLDEALGHCEP